MYNIKDLYYYRKINANDFIKDIQGNYYIDLHMCSTPFTVIKDMQENYVILKNKYKALQFTFSDNLCCNENKIIDIRDIREIGGVYND